MVGIGFAITEVVALITGGIVFGVFGNFMLAGAVMLLITAIWIGTLGNNGIGVLITGWLALFLYFTGSFGYSDILPKWAGIFVIIILGILFAVMIVKTVLGK